MTSTPEQPPYPHCLQYIIHVRHVANTIQEIRKAVGASLLASSSVLTNPPPSTDCASSVITALSLAYSSLEDVLEGNQNRNVRKAGDTNLTQPQSYKDTCRDEEMVSLVSSYDSAITRGVTTNVSDETPMDIALYSIIAVLNLRYIDRSLLKLASSLLLYLLSHSPFRAEPSLVPPYLVSQRCVTYSGNVELCGTLPNEDIDVLTHYQIHLMRNKRNLCGEVGSPLWSPTESGQVDVQPYNENGQNPAVPQPLVLIIAHRLHISLSDTVDVDHCLRIVDCYSRLISNFTYADHEISSEASSSPIQSVCWELLMKRVFHPLFTLAVISASSLRLQDDCISVLRKLSKEYLVCPFIRECSLIPTVTYRDWTIFSKPFTCSFMGEVGSIQRLTAACKRDIYGECRNTDDGSSGCRMPFACRSLLGKPSAFIPDCEKYQHIHVHYCCESGGALSEEALSYMGDVIPDVLYSFADFCGSMVKQSLRSISKKKYNEEKYNQEGTVLADEELHSSYQARFVSLAVLNAVFDALPPHVNSTKEHPCSPWLFAAFNRVVGEVNNGFIERSKLHNGRTFRELLGESICSNIAILNPQSRLQQRLQKLALRLFGLAFHKCHYHFSNELHAVLVTTLMPVLFSLATGYEMKLSIIQMLREFVVSNGNVIVSTFMNHDCNPYFGGGYTMGSEMTNSHLPWEWRAGGSFWGVLISSLTTFLFTCFLPRSIGAYTIAGTYTSFSTVGTLDRVSVISPNQQIFLLEEAMHCVSDLVDSLFKYVFHRHESANGAVEELDEISVMMRMYRWEHVEQLLKNKELLAVVTSKFIVKSDCLQVFIREAMKCGILKDSHPNTVALFLHDSPAHFTNSIKHYLSIALLKDSFNKEVMRHYTSLKRFVNVPLDIAFKEFVCDVIHPEGFPRDKQLPESQAWSLIQTIFGIEYAKQNKRSATLESQPLEATCEDGRVVSPRHYPISEYAADALAGAILFLHSTAHNPNSTKFEACDWILKAKESMQIPASQEDRSSLESNSEYILSDSELQGMYNRTCSSRWGGLQATMEPPTASAGKRQLSHNNSASHHESLFSYHPGISQPKDFINCGFCNQKEIDKIHLRDMLICLDQYASWSLRHSFQIPSSNLARPYINPLYVVCVKSFLRSYMSSFIACSYISTRLIVGRKGTDRIRKLQEQLHDISAVFKLNLSDFQGPAAELIDAEMRRPCATQLDIVSSSTIPFLLYSI